MNYKIIANEDRLIEFIDWLPELQQNEKYYLSLFARKKYCQDMIKSNDKTQLKRFTAIKSNMLDKIKQLEIQEGRWKLKEVSAPQESLVLYITVNPRCMKRATEMMGKKCWDLMNSENYNLHAEALSCIQKSKSRTCFLDFDIDDKTINLDGFWLDENIGAESYHIMETRGGYHLLVYPEKAQIHSVKHHKTKSWYQKIQQKYPVDQTGDQLLPVVGTFQGGFEPRFLK